MRRFFLSWPVGEFVLPNEWARSFHVELPFVQLRWFALDHVLHHGVRLRVRFLKWGA